MPRADPCSLPLTPISSLFIENSNIFIAHLNNTIQPDKTTDTRKKIENLARELSIARQLEMHRVYHQVKRKSVNELIIDIQI